ncbi:MAG: CoA-binding protein [Alphaproteobacteria bacterium]|nr:CoA-binding protein [Alphaproteobacteria bacterium]
MSHTLESVRPILEKARTVAVLGASTHRHRAGFYVPAYLVEHGYRVLPVNPMHVGETLHSQPVRATLAEIDEPVDLVDVFRRPDQLPAHVDDLLALRPAVVWFQLGIRNDAVAERLRAEGIEVVQDRCTLADHRRLF